MQHIVIEKTSVIFRSTGNGCNKHPWDLDNIYWGICSNKKPLQPENKEDTSSSKQTFVHNILKDITLHGPMFKAYFKSKIVDFANSFLLL